MWHGASRNFVVYALLQACAMTFNRFSGERSGIAWPKLLRAAVATLGAAVIGGLVGRLALELSDPGRLALLFGAVGCFVALLPDATRVPLLRPLHVLLAVHFSVLTRLFFRSDGAANARAMAEKLLHWDGLPVRLGLLGDEALTRGLAATHSLAWAVPLAHVAVLLVLLVGFALHYAPVRITRDLALRVVGAVPGPVVGLGFAAAVGACGLLLAGPRPNIYFAF
jgi:alginate O-acetyltransferase complex protein AlgI